MIPVTSYSGKPVAVMGLGRSGIAAARALGAGQARVWGWDDGQEAREKAGAAGIPLVDLYQRDLSEVSTLVLSPGIAHRYPAPHPIVQGAREGGCEIICDIELMARTVQDATYLCITGTNGKSTTTALLGHILKMAGRRVEVGGNFGVPALDLAPLGAGEIYLLELSSYQLELSPGLSCDIAVLLNITPDHLDRHGGWNGYVAAKKRIFDGCGPQASAVIGIDGESCREIERDLASRNGPRVIPISATQEIAGGVYVKDGHLIDDLDNGQETILDLAAIGTLPGRHNWENAAAAYAAARAAGLRAGEIAPGLSSYAGLPHRQELIAQRAGIAFVNDSKATNADAARRALGCYGTIYWIAGGLAKEGGFAAIRPHFPNIRHAFLIGTAADQLADLLGGQVAHTRSGDLDTAFGQALAAAERDGEPPGRVILLSPACASFDQFADFEARGEAFRKLVEGLA